MPYTLYLCVALPSEKAEQKAIAKVLDTVYKSESIYKPESIFKPESIYKPESFFYQPIRQGSRIRLEMSAA